MGHVPTRRADGDVVKYVLTGTLNGKRPFGRPGASRWRRVVENEIRLIIISGNAIIRVRTFFKLTRRGSAQVLYLKTFKLSKENNILRLTRLVINSYYV